jgi:hypothetical protein
MKYKSKFVPVHTMNVWSVGAIEVQLHSFLTSAIAGGECLRARLSGFVLEKEPVTDRIGGWVFFRVRVGVLEKEKCPSTSWMQRRRQQQQQQQHRE